MYKITNISKKISHKILLDSVSFNLEKTELVSILCFSGSGKSTLLKILSGIESATAGSFSFTSENKTTDYIKDTCETAALGQRDIVYVFQEPVLLPHLTIQENIRLGYKSDKISEADLQQMICFFKIENHLKKYPHQLSAGEQQRVSVARALACAPKLLLLDEPFSHLDENIKNQILVDLKHFLIKNKMTTLMVTHNQEEAFLFSSRILVLNQGQLIQQGTPQELFNQPQQIAVAQLLGHSNFLTPEELSYFEIEKPENLNLSKESLILVRPDWFSKSSQTNRHHFQIDAENQWFRRNRTWQAVELPTAKQIWIEELGPATHLSLKIENCIVFNGETL